MAHLVLDPATLKALATANSVHASQDGNDHALTIYPTPDHNRRSVVPLHGIVLGHQVYGDGITPGQSSCYLPHYAAGVFKLLKVGDVLSLSWMPENSTPHLEEHGMIQQSLFLIVQRKVGKQRKTGEDRIEQIRLLIAQSVFSKSSLWLMCRGFPRKERRTDEAVA